MKKTISLILCVIMVMTIATCAFAGGMVIKPGEGGGVIKPGDGGGFKPGAASREDQQAAAAVVAKIAELPDKAYVTADNEAAIVDARTAYDALTDAAKGLVTNLSILTDAEAALAALKAETPSTGDSIVLFVAVAMLSMTGLAVLASKKRAF